MAREDGFRQRTDGLAPAEDSDAELDAGVIQAERRSSHGYSQPRHSDYNGLKVRHGKPAKDGGSFTLNSPDGFLVGYPCFHGWYKGKEFTCQIDEQGHLSRMRGMNGHTLSNKDIEAIASPEFWEKNRDNIHLPPILAGDKRFAGGKDEMIARISKASGSDQAVLNYNVVSGNASPEYLQKISEAQGAVAAGLGLSRGPGLRPS